MGATHQNHLYIDHPRRSRHRLTPKPASLQSRHAVPRINGSGSIPRRKIAEYAVRITQRSPSWNPTYSSAARLLILIIAQAMIPSQTQNTGGLGGLCGHSSDQQPMHPASPPRTRPTYATPRCATSTSSASNRPSPNTSRAQEPPSLRPTPSFNRAACRRRPHSARMRKAPDPHPPARLRRCVAPTPPDRLHSWKRSGSTDYLDSAASSSARTARSITRSTSSSRSKSCFIRRREPSLFRAA